MLGTVLNQSLSFRRKPESSGVCRAPSTPLDPGLRRGDGFAVFAIARISKHAEGKLA
jgi:hypothetical protein